MSKRKRSNLKSALSRIDKTSDEIFGDVDLDLSTLPSLNKPRKEKITANFDADVLEAIRKVADENDASYAAVMNDVLRKVFLSNRKAG